MSRCTCQDDSTGGLCEEHGYLSSKKENKNNKNEVKVDEKIVTWLKKRINAKKDELSKQIYQLDELLRSLTNDNVLCFKIQIFSYWHNEGEKNLSVIYKKESLENAIKKAKQRFKKINNRNDIQGEVRVYICLNNQWQFLLSEKLIREFIKK